MPKSARELAWETLSRWVVLTDPPHIPERDDQAWAALHARDRAQAFDLVTGILRWRGLLDAVMGAFLKQPPATLEPAVRAVLWIGAYQILIQESAKPYAAVDEAVELCKTRGTPKASGLVNAVLRNILRADPKKAPRGPLAASRFPRDVETDIVFNKPLLPPPDRSHQAYLAAATSHPPEFVAMLLGQLPPDKVLEILIADNHRPAIILRADDPVFVPQEKTGLAPHATKGYFIATDGWNATVAELVKRGVLSPQDPTAGLVAAALAERLAPDAFICDLCAGLGTKTIQLARRLPKARIIATDIDRQKLARLATRLTETGITNVTITPLQDLAAVGARVPDARFDAILLDAPCSNTGVFARRVQARWRWPKLDPAAMTQLQMNLLQQATGLLKPGGHLAYATCSIDPAENARVLQRFTAGTTATVLAEQATLPGATQDGGYYFIVRHEGVAGSP